MALQPAHRQGRIPEAWGFFARMANYYKTSIRSLTVYARAVTWLLLTWCAMVNQSSTEQNNNNSKKSVTQLTAGVLKKEPKTNRRLKRTLFYSDKTRQNAKFRLHEFLRKSSKFAYCLVLSDQKALFWFVCFFNNFFRLPNSTHLPETDTRHRIACMEKLRLSLPRAMTGSLF